MKTQKNILNEFKKSIENLSNMKSLRDNFGDFIDFQLFFFCENPTEEEKNWFFSERSAKAEKYTQAMILFGDGSEGYNDILGEFFMCFISKGEKGQYYTPQCVCDLMAEIVGESKGEKICDPCCGSGRMLLSAAKRAEDSRKLSYHANDIDIMCVKMTLLNLLINTLPGVLTHGDGLIPMWLQSRDTYIIKINCVDFGEKLINIATYKKINAQEAKELMLPLEEFYNMKNDSLFDARKIEFTEKVMPLSQKAVQLELFE